MAAMRGSQAVDDAAIAYKFNREGGVAAIRFAGPA
jgi:hypothetical protein